ncbi:TIGR01777 family oxidoreductase [Thermodesulfobacteriota bacterium]
MKILITGGTGFVGTNLSRVLVERGHEVTVLARRRKEALPAGVKQIVDDTSKPGPWMEHVAEHNVLINLAGVSIFGRWNNDYKKLMHDSRILTTRNLVEAIPPDSGKDMTLLSTSAVGYYGFTGDDELAEDSPAGDDFLGRLAKDWEAEALRAREKGVRVAIMRFGVVLGKDGGALEQMTRPFRFFAGGPLGNGRQWTSWIHIEDLCRAAVHLMENEALRGPFNFTAPAPVRNSDLARAIGKTLGRPSFMPAPGFMIKLVLGEFGSVLLKGQRVIPKALEASGFKFEYRSVKQALGDLLVK